VPNTIVPIPLANSPPTAPLAITPEGGGKGAFESLESKEEESPREVSTGLEWLEGLEAGIASFAKLKEGVKRRVHKRILKGKETMTFILNKGLKGDKVCFPMKP
jgi:hypothetical protein